MPIRYNAIWEFGFLEELIGRNNVILQADFDALLRKGEVRSRGGQGNAYPFYVLFVSSRCRISFLAR